MHPVLFKLGPVTVHTYGLLVATGVLLALWLVRRRAAQAGIDPDRAWNLGVYMTLAALVGAKLWLIAQFWSYYVANPKEIFALSTLQSAGVFYGGFLTALFVAFFYAWRSKFKLLPILDVYAAPLALGHAIGRLGCFSAGCCWGRETQVAWGVTFTDPYAGQLIGVPLGVKIHPTQLYESLALFTIFAFLMWLVPRAKFTGQLFGSYAILYGFTRAITESFRGDPSRTMILNGRYSVMQAVSVGLILLGVWLWWRGAKAFATPEPAQSAQTPAGKPAPAKAKKK